MLYNNVFMNFFIIQLKLQGAKMAIFCVLFS